MDIVVINVGLKGDGTMEPAKWTVGAGGTIQEQINELHVLLFW